MIDLATLPKDIAALTALLLNENAARLAAETRALDLDGQIAHLKLTIAKMQRDTHGASSEKGARLLDQMELQLDELNATVAEGKAGGALRKSKRADFEIESAKEQRKARECSIPCLALLNLQCVAVETEGARRPLRGRPGPFRRTCRSSFATSRPE